jgi:hypothetical protein
MTIIQRSIRTLTLFNKNHKKENKLLWENNLGKILVEKIRLHKKTRT